MDDKFREWYDIILQWLDDFLGSNGELFIRTIGILTLIWWFILLVLGIRNQTGWQLKFRGRPPTDKKKIRDRKRMILFHYWSTFSSMIRNSFNGWPWFLFSFIASLVLIIRPDVFDALLFPIVTMAPKTILSRISTGIKFGAGLLFVIAKMIFDHRFFSKE